MKEKVSFKEKFDYWLDKQFSKGTAAMIFWLGMLSAAIIIAAAFLMVVLGIGPEGEGPLGFLEGAWKSLMRTLDAGTMGNDQGTEYRFMMFLVTLAGIFIISTLIGVITSAVEGRLEELRKGRSRVLEQNHIVVLGWSEQIFTIITELMEANRNVKNPCMVIMGDKDKVEMEDEIASKIGNTGNMRIICRSGSPMDMSDLNLVNLEHARSVIVLSTEGEEADSMVIKTVLAVVNHPTRPKDDPCHVVAEIIDPRNMESTKVVGRGQVEWVLVDEFIARIIAQTCWQSGLSVVYTELLDFGGDEIYIKHEPGLVGKKFGEALMMYRKNALVGLQKAGSAPRLGSPMDLVIEKGDRVVVIAEDDGKIILTPGERAAVQLDLIVTGEKQHRPPESTLILGWNKRGPKIVREMDSYAAQGSEVVVACQNGDLEMELAACCPDLKNLRLSLRRTDTTKRNELEALDLERFRHIILLSYSGKYDMQRADAMTLITLLHLREIADQGKLDFTIVSEMLDIRNRNLAVGTRADDFIVSNKLVSLMMAQISETRHLAAVFAEMFDPEGCEIYLKPAPEYVRPGKPVSFYTVVEAAKMRGEIAIGYRLAAKSHDIASQYGVVINPDKAARVTFSAGDNIVVVAED
jgi:voltage-gated potassium channel Kch